LHDLPKTDGDYAFKSFIVTTKTEKEKYFLSNPAVSL
jgi:hypothetical protein